MSSLRYVILHHTQIPEPHYDIMIETDPQGPLMTWRSPVWPIAEETNLIQLKEHRRDYLTYEGPVSNDRGVVARIGQGTCEIEWITRHDLIVKFETESLHLNCLDDDHWVATLDSDKLK
jgi:hypothetical protein